jgi:hypothetical protein
MNLPPDSFKRLEHSIDGVLYVFPTHSELTEIIKSFPDNDSINRFMHYHNGVIELLIYLPSHPDSMTFFENQRLMCNEIGYLYPQLLRDLQISQYCKILFDKYISPIQI